MSKSNYIIGDIVYLRYQRINGANRGEITGIAQVDHEGACEYRVEMPCGQWVMVHEDAMSEVPLVHPVMESALRALNEALAADPAAMTALLKHRVPCNAALRDHPTVQIGGGVETPDVGMLGVINGIIEPLSGKRIAAVYNNIDEHAVRFIAYPMLDNPDPQWSAPPIARSS